MLTENKSNSRSLIWEVLIKKPGDKARRSFTREETIRQIRQAVLDLENLDINKLDDNNDLIV